MIVEVPGEGTNSRQQPVKTVSRPIRWWVSVILWWLLPVAGVLYILWTGYAAVVSPRFGHANSVTGNLLSGESVGQSLVARHDNLSGVELWLGTNSLQNDPSRPEMVVSLYSGSPPERGRLLDTLVLPGGERIRENAWHLFSFAPIPDSRDRAFYVEIESPDGRAAHAITLFSWQAANDAGGDPYAQGTLYRNGEPVPGDLAFGLRYSPSPVAAWLAVARDVSANIPAVIMIAILAAVAATLLWGILRLPAILRHPGRAAAWLSRWSLPVVLAIALLNGAIYVLLVPPWQGPDEHAHFAYAALLDRHGLDDAVVQQLQTPGNTGEDALINAIHASMDRHNFTRLLAGDPRPGAPANTGSSAYWELRQPTTYYWLCAAALRTVRSMGFKVDHYTNPESALLVMRFVSLILSLGVAALAWLAAVLITPSRRPAAAGTADAPATVPGPWLRIVLPFTVMLLPMHAFMASMANNDILAELAVSAVFVTLVALFRWPLGVRGLFLLTTAGLLTGLTAATKQSALAASIPLFFLGFIWWAWRVASHAWSRRQASRAKPNSAGRVMAWSTVGFLLLATLAISALLIIGPDKGAVGWNTSVWPIVHADRQATDTAKEGSFVLQLDPDGGAATAYQMLLPSVYHPALTAHLTAWARVVPPEGTSSPQPGQARILMREGSRTAGEIRATLDPSGDWTQVVVTGTISESTRQLVVRLIGTGAHKVQFDNLSLKLESASGPWAGTLYGGRLLNPSFEVESVAVHPSLVKILPDEAWQIVDVALNDQPFHKLDLWRHYADMEYRSFWGNFGWVSVPLPEPLYVLLGILTLASILGLTLHGVARWGRWSHVEWLGVASLVTFLFTILVGFARQMMALSTLGIAAYPQGRYLFVLMLPICWLWVAGLFMFGSQIWQGVRRWLSARINHTTAPPLRPEVEVANTAQTPQPQPLAWALWLWLTMLLLFTGFCLLDLLVPYYYI